MYSINRISLRKMILLLLFTFLLNENLTAQHRGDNLSFQGLSSRNDVNVKALAMGGAFTSSVGNLASLHFNPAGLSRIKEFQISVSANYYKKHWRENQDYRPDRYFINLPFYLERLYVPDPANNGKWDYQLVQDTNYNYLVKEPKLGVDAYSEEAADWTNDQDKFGFNNITIAMPFQFSDHKFVAAASFSIDNNFYDFDRNQTYLDPHIGYFGYGGDITRVDGKHTMKLHWSEFVRQRIGSLNYFTAGLSYELLENLMLGASLDYMWGESDDLQSLVRVGDFLLSNQQRFTFTYIDGSDFTTGTSKYNSTKFNLGAVFELNKINIGLNVALPYTLTREWNYSNTKDSTTVQLSGTDNLKLPAVFTVGIGFQPVENLSVKFDYEYAPFGKAEAELASNDSTFNNWVNRNTLRFGLEYRAWDFLSFMAGYRSIPQTFVPDGAAITSKGPEANSYTFGLSFNLFFGQIDLAYELRILKYYDSYFSNTNYAFEKSTNLMLGYTYRFN